MENFEHLENLSKLKFSDDEKKQFDDEFKNIIAFVDEILDLELTENIDTSSAVKLDMLRSDKAQPCNQRDKILGNAPKQKDGQFVVPLVVE